VDRNGDRNDLVSTFCFNYYELISYVLMKYYMRYYCLTVDRSSIKVTVQYLTDLKQFMMIHKDNSWRQVMEGILHLSSRFQ